MAFRRLPLCKGKGLKNFLPVLGLLGAALLAPQPVCAAGILETIGISTAVGTVLGASTLPFYEQPGDHTGNVTLGAAAGAVVGVGVVIYQALSGNSDERAQLESRMARTRREPRQPDFQGTLKNDRERAARFQLVSLSW